MSDNYHTEAAKLEPGNIYESLDQMINLYTQQIANMRQLKRALRLAELIGVRPGDLKWTLITRWEEGHGPYPWREATLHVLENHPDGPIGHKFDMVDEVHPELWPDHLRQAFEMYKARMSKRRTRGGN
jgi:hypothetical protein